MSYSNDVFLGWNLITKMDVRLIVTLTSRCMLTFWVLTYDRQLTVIQRTPLNECIVITEGGLAIVNANHGV